MVVVVSGDFGLLGEGAYRFVVSDLLIQFLTHIFGQKFISFSLVEDVLSPAFTL